MSHYQRGDDWSILGVQTTDGDTVKVSEVLGFRPEGEPWFAGGLVHRHLIEVRLDPEVWPRGRLVRLVTLNTPEKGRVQPGGLPDGRKGTWAEARSDLGEWLNRWKRLRVETWEEPGNFGRWLGDVYVEGRRDLTASAHMLSLGWDPYLSKPQQHATRFLL